MHCSELYTTILEIELVFSLENKLELGICDGIELGSCDGFWLGVEVGIESIRVKCFLQSYFTDLYCTSVKGNICSLGLKLEF